MACCSPGCTNIAIMQLFHELKQRFPAVPDEVVMKCIRQHAHNKEACERALRRRCQAYMVHSYPSALMTGMEQPSHPGHAEGGVDGKGARSPESSPVDVARLNIAAQPLSPPGPGPGPATPARSTATFRHLPRKLRPAPPPPPRLRPAPLPPAAPSPGLLSPTYNLPSTPPPGPPTGLPLGPPLGPPLGSPPGPPPGPPPGLPPRPPPASAASDDVTTVLDVNCSVRPVVPGARHASSVALQPASPYAVGELPPRSYTSVNLTLRPPSSEPQPPIDIHSAGSSLTYSTSSYDPRQGYQSQLQIRIGPGGLGSVSAMRTRAPMHAPPVPAPTPVPAPAPAPTPRHPLQVMSPLVEHDEQPSMPAREDLVRRVIAMGGADLRPDMREHLVRQLERRTLLETELSKERNKLQIMQKEVADMERDLQMRTEQTRPRGPPALPVMEKVQRLRNEIQSLQEECTRMANEVDAKAPETRPEERSSEPGWTCQTCTFHNHYLLEACETCDVPRIRLGSDCGSSGLHALRLTSLQPTGILPSLAAPALDAALAPLSLNSSPSAMCVPNTLTILPPGHEE